MEDGCPCNTPAGVNNLNLYRWNLLHKLQQQQSQELDTTVETLKSKHSQFMARVRSLSIKDNASKGLQMGVHSLERAHELIGEGVDDSIDNISQRINERSDVAQEEFKRTMATFDTPPDPTKDAAVDDILTSLRPAPATAAKA